MIRTGPAAPPSSRLPRAAVFAAVCVVLAAAAHRTASGHPVPLPALLLGFAVVCCAARLGSARSARTLGDRHDLPSHRYRPTVGPS